MTFSLPAAHHVLIPGPALGFQQNYELIQKKTAIDLLYDGLAELGRSEDPAQDIHIPSSLQPRFTTDRYGQNTSDPLMVSWEDKHWPTNHTQIHASFQKTDDTEQSVIRLSRAGNSESLYVYGHSHYPPEYIEQYGDMETVEIVRDLTEVAHTMLHSYDPYEGSKSDAAALLHSQMIGWGVAINDTHPGIIESGYMMLVSATPWSEAFALVVSNDDKFITVDHTLIPPPPGIGVALELLDNALLSGIKAEFHEFPRDPITKMRAIATYKASFIS